MKNNSVYFAGNANNVQIQQNSQCSFQNSSKDNYDFQSLKILLDQLNKMKEKISAELPSESEQLFDNVDVALAEVEQKSNSSRLKNSLSFMRDFAVEFSAGLAAAGAFELINSICF